MTNFIDETAAIGGGTTFGANTVVEKDVVIGTNCQIGHNVVIHEGSIIGDNVRIDDQTVVGKQPMRSKRSIFKDEKKLSPAKIGNDCLIGAGVVVYAGCEIANNVLIADTAAVRENVTVGEYTIIGRGATVENFTTIGKKCKLETGSYITAYSVVEDYCFIAPNVTTTNDNYLGRTKERFKHFKGVTVRRGGRIGGGAVILPGLEIGRDAVVAAGAVVTKNVPPRQIWAGVPANYFRDTPEAQLLENQGWD
ncbi:dTDP-3-amino-3,6-dideoxy-alpha-D-galactopyranose 3-N-acetyltransferase [bacterium BMS3Bbin03]|nr:dTDP-3-amino-3,6-dideoxy-alpha-D-galactopyranose 3-N-acetyltransferase [bacterium BMS3Bbin03]HDZ12485.1 N-acetyltransferase [Bacteroidota bacterium]